MFISMQKIDFMPPFFLEMQQRYCKLIVLSDLGMPGYSYQKGWYQLVENFDVCLQAKIKYVPPFFLKTLLRYCLLVILGTLDRPSRIQQKQQYELVGKCHVYLHTKKSTSSLLSFLRYYTLKNIILNKNIIFHFRLFPRKITTSLFKKCKTIFGPFSPFLGKTEFSPKLCSYKLLFLILIKYQCAKLKKKLLIGFQTPVSAGRTDAQTNKHELHEK